MRYAGWRRLKGDLDRPDLLDMGKRMLGFLENQRRLSGVQTQAMYRELPDGSVVMARWLGNLPEIMVKEGPPRGTMAWVDGFALRPTTAARSTQNWDGSKYGTGAFEVANYRLQVLLTRPLSSADTALAPVWFDANPLWWPGDPAPADYYGPLLGDEAFRYAGSLDWTGTGGVLYFFGPRNRFCANAFEYYPQVFHNGRVLVDLSGALDTSLGVSPVVLGAALSGTVDNPGRVLITTFDNDDWDWGLPMVLQVVAVAVRWEGGHLVAATNDDDQYEVQVLGSYTLADTSFQIAPMFWNQRGDECRGIQSLTDPESYLLTGMVEVVASRNTDGTFAFSVTSLPMPVEGYVTTADSSGSISLATGDIVTDLALAFPDTGTNDPTSKDATFRNRTYTGAEWFKVAVDYRNNVPVYLEHKPKYGHQNLTSTYARTVLAGDTNDGYLQFGVGTTEGWTRPGATDVDYGWEGPWPELPYGKVQTEIINTEDRDIRSAYRTDWLTLEDVDAYAGTITTAQEVEAINNFDGYDAQTTTTSYTRTATVNDLVYVDLRHRLLHYHALETEDAIDSEVEVVQRHRRTGYPTRSKITDETYSGSFQFRIRVVFNCNGIDVEDTLAKEVVTVPTSPVHTEDTTWAWSFEPSLYTRLVTKLPVYTTVSGEETITNDNYQLPQRPGLGYADDHDGQFEESVGSWVRSRNLVAYSYPIKFVDGSSSSLVKAGPSYTPTSDDFISGFCTTDGVKLAIDIGGLIFDDGNVRHFPIMAISPYRR